MKKTDMVKRTAGIFALAAVMFSFSGCDSNVPQQSSNSESSVSIQDDSVKQQEETYGLKMTPVGADHVFDNIKSLQYSGENIYVYEQSSGVVQKEISTDINISESQSRDVDISAIDYLYIQYMARNEKELCMTYCDNENNLRICLIDIETGKLIADNPISIDEQIFSLRTDSNGNFTAVKNVYTDTGITYRYSVLDARDLTVISETDFSEKFIASENEIVTEAFSLQDGSIIFFTADYKPDFSIEEFFYRINPDGEAGFTAKKIENQEGHPAGMYAHENGSICVCTTDDYSEYFVYEIDSKTGETKDVYTLDAGSDSKIISGFMLDGYDLTYISSAGVTGYSFKDGRKDVVLEFGKDLDPALRDSFTASSYGDSAYMYLVTNVESGRLVTSVNKDGKTEFSTELPTTLGYVSMFGTAPDGTVIYSETYDPGQKKETSTGFNMAYKFHVLDKKASPKSSFSIDEIDSLGDAVIQSIDIAENGDVYMLFQTFVDNVIGTRIYVTDKNGKILNRYILDSQSCYITDVVLSESGNYALCLDADNKTCYFRLDPEKPVIKDEYETLDISGSVAVLRGSGNCDVYFRDENRIFGYSLADRKETDILDLSELAGQTAVSEVYVINDSRIVCSTYDSETGETGVVILEK